MKGLTGKVAIVTGGSSGIGRATAEAFAREGVKVVVADVSLEGGEQTVQGIKATGGDATFIKADVSNSVEVQSMIGTTIKIYGGLDFACNNAGIGGDLAMTANYPENAWQRVIDINLTGVFLCMKYEIPSMLQRGGGVIVNMASILGHVGFRKAIPGK